MDFNKADVLQRKAIDEQKAHRPQNTREGTGLNRKLIFVLCAVAVIIMVAFAPTMGGTRIDDPYMLMVNDVLYIDTFTPLEDVRESDILGYTESYTKKEPRKNGQANFEKGTAYAVTENGLAVQRRSGEWILFKPYSK